MLGGAALPAVFGLLQPVGNDRQHDARSSRGAAVAAVDFDVLGIGRGFPRWMHDCHGDDAVAAAEHELVGTSGAVRRRAISASPNRACAR